MITFEQFANEISEFRALMGSRSFWQLPEKHHDGAMAGLAHAYFLVPVADIERAAVAYDATMVEYLRRKYYVDFNPNKS